MKVGITIKCTPQIVTYLKKVGQSSFLEEAVVKLLSRPSAKISLVDLGKVLGAEAREVVKITLSDRLLDRAENRAAELGLTRHMFLNLAIAYKIGHP